jgi:hypothetical protein
MDDKRKSSNCFGHVLVLAHVKNASINFEWKMGNAMILSIWLNVLNWKGYNMWSFERQTSFYQ